MLQPRRWLSFCVGLLIVSACATAQDERLGVTSDGLTLDAGNYSIVGSGSGLCVQIAGASSANSARVQIQPCTGQPAQTFRISATSSAGYYTLRSVLSDKCLDVDARSTADGANIIQYTCNSNTNQQWQLADVSGGRVRLVVRHSKKVAEAYGSSASGTYLSQRASASRSNQYFTIMRAGSGTAGAPGTGGAGVGSAGTGGVGGGGSNDTLGSKAEIEAAMALANDYFMAKWPDPGKDIVTDKTRPSHIWTRSVYYEGLMALYGVSPQQRYYDYAVRWGQSHAFGLNGGATTRNADNQCAGQTYIDLYRVSAAPERIRDIKASVDAMVSSTLVNDWTWVDAVQMSMPVFAKLGALYNDNRYLEKMYSLYDYAKNVEGGNGLYSDTDHLWWRDKDFDPPYTEPNGQDCYWSRGNGWVYAALVRVLDTIAEDAPHRAEYLADYLAMSEALRAVQRSDGFWNVSLHDATHYGGKELSGTALFAYGMAWGVRTGKLDANVYRPLAVRAWNAMVKDALHQSGFLGYVQSTGKQPSDGQPLSYDKVPNFEDYGLGAFLLAGSEIDKLAAQ